MSTQLYSSWLATTKPQCYLSHPMPQQVILPPEYQPNLEQRLPELSVDFSLEESILKQAHGSSDPGTTEAASRTFGPNSLLRPEKLTHAKPNTVSEPSSKSHVETASETIINPNSTNMDIVLNQFDTLNITPEPPSDDIKQHLAELFSIPAKTASPQRSSEANSQSIQQGLSIPNYSRRDLIHSSPGPGPSNDFYSNPPTHNIAYSNNINYQKSFPGYYSSPGTNSPIDNLRPHNGMNNNEAPPLPPPNPLPKPIDLDVTKTNEMDPEIDVGLNQLISMGFSQNSALQALQKNNGSLDQAIEALLSGQF